MTGQPARGTFFPALKRVIASWLSGLELLRNPGWVAYDTAANGWGGLLLPALKRVGASCFNGLGQLQKLGRAVHDPGNGFALP